MSRFASHDEFFAFISQVCLHLSQIEGEIWMPRKDDYSRVSMVSQNGYLIYAREVFNEPKISFVANTRVAIKKDGFEGQDWIKGNHKIFVSDKKDALRIAKEISSRLLSGYKPCYEAAMEFAKAELEYKIKREEMTHKACEVIGCQPPLQMEAQCFHAYTDFVRKVTVGVETIDVELRNLSLDKLRRVMAVINAD